MRCKEIFLSGRRDRERERVVGKGVGMQPETFPTSEKATTFCVFSHEIFLSVQCPLPAALIDLPLSALSLDSVKSHSFLLTTRISHADFVRLWLLLSSFNFFVFPLNMYLHGMVPKSPVNPTDSGLIRFSLSRGSNSLNYPYFFSIHIFEHKTQPHHGWLLLWLV